MTDIINVAIVDDDPIYRAILKAQFKRHSKIQIIFEASNGKELISLLRKHKIDIVLLDLNMPVMDGTETLKYLTKFYRGLKTIILTVHTNKLQSYDLIINKAWGFLHKNKEIDKIADSIYTVYNGVYYIGGSWDLPQILIEEKQSAEPKKIKVKSIIKATAIFSPREMQILKLIYNQYTTKEISEKLYISMKTVDWHRDSMLQKTGSKNIVGLIRYVIFTDIFRKVK